MRFVKYILLFSPFILNISYSKELEGNKRSMLRDLNLSKQQLQELKEHRKSNKGQKKELSSQIKDLRRELKTKFVAGASDDELADIHSKIKAIRSKIDDQRFNKMLELKNILNDKQRKRFMNSRENNMNVRQKN